MLKNMISGDTFDRAKKAAAEKLSQVQDLGGEFVGGRTEAIRQALRIGGVKVFKLRETAHMPTYGTEWASCFDLRSSIQQGDVIRYFTQSNVDGKHYVQDDGKFTLMPGWRALIPTGLIFDLDENQTVRVHPRSGLAIKSGITLANCEGVIDADYVEECFITVFNVSDQPYKIEDGMRLAQGEVIESAPIKFNIVTERPARKTDRVGGFGSTGV